MNATGENVTAKLVLLGKEASAQRRSDGRSAVLTRTSYEKPGSSVGSQAVLRAHTDSGVEGKTR